jgi:glycosyltransferase involved in cell wall biosynthesis
MKKVSIIIPYRDDRGWLDKAIQSVDNQTHPNVELIISQGRCGVSKNLNKGIKQATGDYIKYLCDDDLLDSRCIENSLKGFKKGVDFIHGNAKSFQHLVSNGNIYRPIKKNLRLDHLLKHNYIHGGTLMYKAEVFDKVGLFNETLWTGEEYEFNLRALSMGMRINYVDELLYYYRLHPRQKSIGTTDASYQALRKEQIETIKSWYK